MIGLCQTFIGLTSNKESYKLCVDEIDRFEKLFLQMLKLNSGVHLVLRPKTSSAGTFLLIS